MHRVFRSYNCTLSIPLWSDFIDYMEQQFRTEENILSIPLWSDFIYGYIVRNASTLNTFNPTMVWFYRKGVLRESIEHRLYFQSHYGLILSWANLIEHILSLFAFNPTMVWFYRAICCQKERWSYCFQSHYGLILSSLSYQVNYESFNLSIPLWSDFIKVVVAGTGTLEKVILSIPLWSDFIVCRTCFRGLWGCHFQSHYGLILSITDCLSLTCSSSLSIPLWSDFIAYTQRIVEFLSKLSIPLWSDFIVLVQGDTPPVDYPFNPTMVWFYH